MANNIEIEAKALVSEKDYKKFIERFKKEAEESYSQTNFYIDDKNMSLIKHGIALRVRKKDSYELTLKTPLSEGLLEKNQDITEKEFTDFKEHKKFPEGDIKRFLTMLGFSIDNLYIITSLSTIRSDIKYCDGLLSLDKNTYNGKTDYEIEFEYNSEIGAKNILKQLFAELDVRYVDNKKSKVRRAYKTLK